jgi:hypothetical protein
MANRFVQQDLPRIVPFANPNPGKGYETPWEKLRHQAAIMKATSRTLI